MSNRISTPAELNQALSSLGWSRAELCRRLGLHRNTPGGWRASVPQYVAEYVRVSLLLREALYGHE